MRTILAPVRDVGASPCGRPEEGDRDMRISTSMRWLVVAVSAAMLLAVAAACSSETVEVPGETVVVEKEVI